MLEIAAHFEHHRANICIKSAWQILIKQCSTVKL